MQASLLPEPPPDSSVSKSELARELGLSRSRITQLVAAGLPVLPNGRIDRAAGMAWVEANLDPSRRRKAANPAASPGALNTVRADKEAEQTKLLRLKVAERKGALVDRAAVENVILTRAQRERDAHLGWIIRLAPVLAAELGVDPRRLFAALDREMRAHLEELSRTPLEALDDAIRR